LPYRALATDYDGTLAHHGQVAPETIDALQRLKTTGRRLILVTGRQLEDLRRIFPESSLFDAIVAENGAVLYEPPRTETRLLAKRPPESFIDELRRRGVDPIFIGQVVVATVQPNEVAALQVIRDLGLELEIIFNKGSVMMLPAGVTKASGLAAALQEFGISPAEVVAIGDAENDHALLTMSGCGVAVANALDSLKADADMVTSASNGEGVREVIDSLVTEAPIPPIRK
jgi:phosphoglycolate phosphatase (TIGR01487 family)